MLDSLYKSNKIAPDQLTATAIKRMRWSAILATPAVPLYWTLEAVDPQKYGIATVVIAVLTLISGIAFLILSLNPLTTTLSRTNKNLDEWEISKKQAAESFGYRVMLHGAAVAFFLFIITDYFVFTEMPFVINKYDVPLVLVSFCFLLQLTTAFYIAFTTQPVDLDINETDDGETVLVQKYALKTPDILWSIGLSVFVIGFVLFYTDMGHDDRGHRDARAECNANGIEWMDRSGFMNFTYECNTSEN